MTRMLQAAVVEAFGAPLASGKSTCATLRCPIGR